MIFFFQSTSYLINSFNSEETISRKVISYPGDFDLISKLSVVEGFYDHVVVFGDLISGLVGILGKVIKDQGFQTMEATIYVNGKAAAALTYEWKWSWSPSVSAIEVA